MEENPFSPDKVRERLLRAVEKLPDILAQKGIKVDLTAAELIEAVDKGLHMSRNPKPLAPQKTAQEPAKKKLGARRRLFRSQKNVLESSATKKTPAKMRAINRPQNKNPLAPIEAEGDKSTWDDEIGMGMPSRRIESSEASYHHQPEPLSQNDEATRHFEQIRLMNELNRPSQDEEPPRKRNLFPELTLANSLEDPLEEIERDIDIDYPEIER